MPDETIIVRREAEEEHSDHHGGGWKVAYADFMTAMMAFFLLLWILSSADEDQLAGLAKYFSPVLLNSSGSGPGVLDGQPAEEDEGDRDVGQPVGVEDTTMPSFGQTEPLAVFDSRLRHEAQPEVVVEYVETTGEPAGEAEQPAPEPAEAEKVDNALEQAREKLESGLAAAANGEALSEHVRIERTEEGLEVQIVDLETGAMFERGSSRIEAETLDLIAIIGDAIAGLPNRVIIAGHTDAVPFSRDRSLGQLGAVDGAGPCHAAGAGRPRDLGGADRPGLRLCRHKAASARGAHRAGEPPHQRSARGELGPPEGQAAPSSTGRVISSPGRLGRRRIAPPQGRPYRPDGQPERRPRLRTGWKTLSALRPRVLPIYLHMCSWGNFV